MARPFTTTDNAANEQNPDARYPGCDPEDDREGAELGWDGATTEAERHSAADVRERALAHIKRCDELFDGNVIRQDREFAYNQVRLLALELLEMVVESG